MALKDLFKKSATKETEEPKKAKEVKEVKSVAKENTAPKKKVAKTSVAPKSTATKVKVNKEDTKDAYKVLKYPLLTEKVSGMGDQNKYVFAVDRKTTKNEIKKAIKSVYGVIPVKVNIINLKSRNVRWGRIEGKTNAWKKAIVSLDKNEKIEIIEGV